MRMLVGLDDGRPLEPTVLAVVPEKKKTSTRWGALLVWRKKEESWEVVEQPEVVPMVNEAEKTASQLEFLSGARQFISTSVLSLIPIRSTSKQDVAQVYVAASAENQNEKVNVFTSVRQFSTSVLSLIPIRVSSQPEEDPDAIEIFPRRDSSSFHTAPQAP